MKALNRSCPRDHRLDDNSPLHTRGLRNHRIHRTNRRNQHPLRQGRNAKPSNRRRPSHRHHRPMPIANRNPNSIERPIRHRHSIAERSQRRRIARRSLPVPALKFLSTAASQSAPPHSMTKNWETHSAPATTGTGGFGISGITNLRRLQPKRQRLRMQQGQSNHHAGNAICKPTDTSVVQRWLEET